MVSGINLNCLVWRHFAKRSGGSMRAGKWVNKEKVPVTLSHRKQYRRVRGVKSNSSAVSDEKGSERSCLGSVNQAAQGHLPPQPPPRLWPRSSASEKESCQFPGAVVGPNVGALLLIRL